MSNRLYIIISLLILGSIYFIFKDNILLCSDHRNYLLMLEFLKGTFDSNFTLRIGLDSLIDVIYLFNKNIDLKNYYLLLTLMPIFVYLIAIFIVKNNLRMTNVFLLMSAPFIFSITFAHFWTCGYRQGLSTSFLILLYAILYTLEKRNRTQNTLILIIVCLLGLLTHWTFIFFGPLFLFNRFTKIINYTSNIILKRENNLAFLVIITITGILIVSSFSFFGNLLNESLIYFLAKYRAYGLEDGLGFGYSYGKRFGILLLVAYAPYILTRCLLILKTSKLNLYLKDQFIITLFFYSICIVGSFTGLGNIIRILIPLQLTSVLNIILNMKYYPRILFLSSLLLMTVLATGNIYYLYIRSLTYTPVYN